MEDTAAPTNQDSANQDSAASTHVANACNLLRQVRDDTDGALLILTGAGMSVASGVPVFRNSNGSMSPEFLAFLKGYNEARRRHNLAEADDWFDFSVPDMFDPPTAVQAWHYWRWRILRARVEPAQDYQWLQALCDYFNTAKLQQDADTKNKIDNNSINLPKNRKVFVVTSNCDNLHARSGTDPDAIKEIHGSLGLLQCSEPCCRDLYPVDDGMLQNLKDNSKPNWIPMCPKCQTRCLRPNVMIFDDWALVHDKLQEQQQAYQAFLRHHCGNNFVILEIGAGTVVPSIRWEAETKGEQGHGLIRINPSPEECADSSLAGTPKYVPLVATSSDGLRDLCRGLGLLEANEEKIN